MAKPALVQIALCLGLAALAEGTPIVSAQFFSGLTTGSLTGTSFPVSFSYDAGQVNPIGDSFITLNSIDFTLLGVAFGKQNILQGGQVILHDGVLENVTASFQGPPLPPNSPVENITFGFGGPGIIGYIDLNGQFGDGGFTFVPEPATAQLFAIYGVMLACLRFPVQRFRGRGDRQRWSRPALGENDRP